MFELAADGRIELRLASLDAGRQPMDCIVEIHLRVATGAPVVRFAIDVYDNSDTFETTLLENCTIYFKRSFYRPDVDRLPRVMQLKVVPFGMNYACRSARGESRLLESGLHLDTSLNGYRQVLTLEESEQAPDTAVAPSILFQTRAWDPESTNAEVEDLNESRARIIRTLRAAFPGMFQGGFIASPFAKRHYPELVSEISSELSQYIRFSKRHLIAVSTRGLYHSVPFKLPEYMAASLAIVSEPLRNELAASLVSGRDFLEFHTPDECVKRCDRILSSPALAAALRRASWQYYRSEVRPARHIANVLERAAGRVSR